MERNRDMGFVENMVYLPFVAEFVFACCGWPPFCYVSFINVLAGTFDN
jgi:hypothetical protein